LNVVGAGVLHLRGVVSPRSEEFLRKAVEAEETASKCRDLIAKQTYEETASMWREMARLEERRG
jgi:hypothetical protein